MNNLLLCTHLIPSQSGQYPGKSNASSKDGLPNPVDNRVDRTHAELSSFVHECYRCTADTAGDRSHYQSHEQDQDREESSEFVFPQRSKCDQGGYHVHKDG